MIYFYAKNITQYKHTDAKRFILTGYVGDIYKALDTAEYGGGVEHCTEWVNKHVYEIKTKAEAQNIVDAGIITYNNNTTDNTLDDRPAIVQGDITLE